MSKSTTTHNYKKICSECKSQNLLYDDLHDELYCFDCGLVLVAPSYPEVVYPGYIVVFVKEE